MRGREWGGARLSWFRFPQRQLRTRRPPQKRPPRVPARHVERAYQVFTVVTCIFPWASSATEWKWANKSVPIGPQFLFLYNRRVDESNLALVKRWGGAGSTRPGGWRLFSAMVVGRPWGITVMRLRGRPAVLGLSLYWG